MLNAPRLGAAVLAGAEFGVDRFRRYMAEVLAGDGLVAAAEATSLVLVAVTETDEIAGLLIAFPPSNVIQQHLDSPHVTDRNRVMFGGITQLSKVRALAVDPKWRGRGIGAGLLRRYKAIYTACHYLHLYGQFEVPKRRGFLGLARSAVTPGDDLAAFYSRQGFTVLREREPLDFFVVFGMHGAIFPDRNERFFSYLRPSRS